MYCANCMASRGIRDGQPHQYSRINAVLAIMNATSVLTCFARDTDVFDV